MDKKFPVLLSLLVILVMTLAACAPGENNGGTPGIEDALGTDDGLGVEGTDIAGTDTGEDLLDTPVATTIIPTEPVITTEPPVTEEVAPTEEVGEGTESPDSGEVLPGTGALNPALASNLMEYDICDTGDQQLADVNDLVLDFGMDEADGQTTDTDSTGTDETARLIGQGQGQVRYLVAGAGGILGIGERDILIPWEAVSLNQQGEAGVDAANACLLVNVPQESLQEVPEVDLSAADLQSETWDSELSSFWETQTLDTGESGTDAGTGTETPEEMDTSEDTGTPSITTEEAGTTPAATDAAGTGTSEGTPEATPAGDTGTDVSAGSMAGSLDQAFLASELIGMNVQGVGDEDLGAVEDVMIDVESGRILYLLIAGGELDLGGELLPIPVVILSQTEDGEALQLPTDAAQLSTVPTFSAEELVDTSTIGWDDEIQIFWNDLFRPGTTPPDADGTEDAGSGSGTGSETAEPTAGSS